MVLAVDSTIDSVERNRLVRRLVMDDPADSSRVRVDSRKARDILGLDDATWYRYRRTKAPYTALSRPATVGRQTFYYLDEIERLRDGLHPITGLPVTLPEHKGAPDEGGATA